MVLIPHLFLQCNVKDCLVVCVWDEEMEDIGQEAECV